MQTLTQSFQRGLPVQNGVPQNYYKFRRPKVAGVYWIGYEYDGAWSDSISGALSFLPGTGWTVVSIDKHETV